MCFVLRYCVLGLSPLVSFVFGNMEFRSSRFALLLVVVVGNIPPWYFICYDSLVLGIRY